jgi:hypothetical protein
MNNVRREGFGTAGCDSIEGSDSDEIIAPFIHRRRKTSSRMLTGLQVVQVFMSWIMRHPFTLSPFSLSPLTVVRPNSQSGLSYQHEGHF